MTTQHTPAWAIKALEEISALSRYDLQVDSLVFKNKVSEIITRHAPDYDALLAALSELAEYVDAYEWGRKWAGRPHEIMDAARAAIQKAKGLK